ncbi:hypothetical protein EMIT0P43_30561 [Pseudomonas jessenii]|nr:hypothetical protein PS843_00751 [Pseudomonas fluorescens]
MPHQEPCGSELARDGNLSDTLMLNVLTLSRASSLPQWFFMAADYEYTRFHRVRCQVYV